MKISKQPAPGYFNDAEKEYVITDMKPRRPLINYLWNESVVNKLNHFGYGNCLACVDSVRRTFINGERHIYVKRDGEYYSANRNFADLPFQTHETRVGLGYQRVISEYKGLKVEMTVCVPEDGLVEITNVRFVNTGAQEAAFQAYIYIRPVINTSVHTSYSRAGLDAAAGGLLYTHNHYRNDNFPSAHTLNTIFVKADRRICSWDVSNDEFIGCYNRTDNPMGLSRKKLSCCGATFDDSACAAMQFEFRLLPGKEASVNIVAAVGEDREKAVSAASEHCGQAAYLDALKRQKTLNGAYGDVFRAETPDEYFNSMVNIWLKRQVSLGKTWGRVYGRGFRDVLQDVTGFVSMDAPLAKKRILITLKYQRLSGSTIRMYDPILEENYNDGAAWIPAAVSAYINESGDLGILNESVGYYDGSETESVFAHLTRGVEFLTTNTGKHGLSLWGGGDWNDSMNNCGKKGIGESVWLSIAAVKAVKEYAEIAALCGADAKIYLDRAEKLTESIFKHGFEGDRFIYGYNDEGKKIGSKDSEQAKLYLNPQTWAVLAGIADGELAEKIMASVENGLKTKFGYKQCFPSYSKGDDGIGRVSYFTEGLCENGSVYLHGVMFKIVSDCLLGKGNEAYKTFLATRYDNPENPRNGMEPYAVSNMYIGDECPYPQLVGYAPMSWVTGSAGWLYRGLTEYILGIRPTKDGLKIEPALPDGWDNIRVIRKFRGNYYDITIIRAKESRIIADGKEQQGKVFSCAGKNQKVICYYKGLNKIGG